MSESICAHAHTEIKCCVPVCIYIYLCHACKSKNIRWLGMYEVRGSYASSFKFVTRRELETIFATQTRTNYEGLRAILLEFLIRA